MRDLKTRRNNGPMKHPAGVAFEIADLVLAGFWSAIHDFQMQVRLDHGDGDEECEEVIEFRTGTSSACRFIMWRTAETVFLQPILGKRVEYKSVADALDGLSRRKNGR